MEESTAETAEQNLFDLLPDELFFHILSFLNIDDLFRFSSLSKRCRTLCLTCPSLTYDSKLIPQFHDISSAVNSTFDRFLVARGYYKIKRLSILWDSNRRIGANYRALTWLIYSFRCEIEEIELKFRERIRDLPGALYSCPSLRSLSLDLNKNYLKFPYSSRTFANLYYLHLKDVGIRDEFGKWISSCKTIKKMCLDDVFGFKSLDIESPSLELFVVTISFVTNTHTRNISVSGERVETISVRWKVSDSGNKVLKFSTPNLKYFYWSGDFVSKITMSNLMHLECVGFLLSHHDAEYISPISCSILGNSIASAKEFHVDGFTVKILYEHGCLTGLSFDVETLFIYVSEGGDLNEYFLPAAFNSLFAGVHNLKTLCIKGKIAEKNENVPPFLGCGHDMKYWESEDLPIVEQLEKVEVDVFNGGNELELAKYLLKHAKNLKEMTVVHFATLPSHVWERLNKFKLMCDQMDSITSPKAVFSATKPFPKPPAE